MTALKWASLTLAGLALVVASVLVLASGCSRDDPPARRGRMEFPSGGAIAHGAAARSSPWVASVYSEIFHHSDCRYAGRIPDANLVGYATAAAARADGRRPCKVCRP